MQFLCLWICVVLEGLLSMMLIWCSYVQNDLYSLNVKFLVSFFSPPHQHPLKLIFHGLHGFSPHSLHLFIASWSFLHHSEPLYLPFLLSFNPILINKNYFPFPFSLSLIGWECYILYMLYLLSWVRIMWKLSCLIFSASVWNNSGCWKVFEVFKKIHRC